MPVTLTNLQRWGPLLVPLASGTTLRLSPGQTSAELPDVDVQDNPMIDKLRRQGLVEVTTAEAAAEAAAETDAAGKAPAAKASAAKGQSRSKPAGAGDASPPDGGGSA